MQPEIKITLCMVSFNRVEESKMWVRRHSPHVDRTIIIDGGSTDGSVEFFNSQECKDIGVECYVSQWIDDPPGQRNKYLDLVTDGWLLVLDCDELIEIPALYDLRSIAQKAENANCDGVAFRSHDVLTNNFLTGKANISLSSYYNRVFFKASPKMKYVGRTHVALLRYGMRDRCMQTEYRYFHIKSWADQHVRACRNYWTTCAVANNREDDPVWINFKRMVSHAGFVYFHQFLDYMRNGNIDISFKEWFIEHRDDVNPEARSWFVSYFVCLHPEENMEKLYNKDIEYKPDRNSIKLHA